MKKSLAIILNLTLAGLSFGNTFEEVNQAYIKTYFEFLESTGDIHVEKLKLESKKYQLQSQIRDLENQSRIPNDFPSNNDKEQEIRELERQISRAQNELEYAKRKTRLRLN